MASSQPTGNRSGCLPAIFRIFGIGGRAAASSQQVPASFPYRCVDSLLTPAERSFYGVLQQAVGSTYLIVMKVRLADVLEIPKGEKAWRWFFNKIQAKHLDFLLCDPRSTRPILAIELDDRSHNGEKRMSRDRFLGEAMRVACLPLLRVPCKRGYSVHDLEARIRDAVQPLPRAG